MKELLAYRLNAHDAAAARREWHDLVEGQHALWGGLSHPYKHTIRAFLVHFHSAILRHASERFNFRNGSVGEHPSHLPVRSRLLSAVFEKRLEMWSGASQYGYLVWCMKMRLGPRALCLRLLF